MKLVGYIFDTDLPPTETLLMLALADYVDQDGRCWPSKETLARRSRVSKRTVDKYLLRLAENDWLKIEQRGGRQSNIYQLNLNKIYAEGHRLPCEVCTPENSVRVQDLHPTPATHVAPELPIEVKKHRQPKKTLPAQSAKKPSQHRWFIAWWCHAYQQIVDQKYAITKKDVGQVANLLKRLPLEEATARACEYLALPAWKRFPRGSPTLGGLLCQINEVGSGFDDAMEKRFVDNGLLPDFEQPGTLTDFQPWRQNA